ncbi:MAG: hypothetical protein N3I35_06700 [Clostridia bacterium]|nr:hypothetical protein [Clostridia bacterium]
MAFEVIKCGGRSIPIVTEYLMADNEACTKGEGLALTSGRLTKVAATAAPEFIAQKSVAASASPTVLVPVIKVDENVQLEVMSTGQITTPGAKYTIHTDGLQITTTTTSGVFEVVRTDGATTSKVRGYFNV